MQTVKTVYMDPYKISKHTDKVSILYSSSYPRLGLVFYVPTILR